MRDSLCHASPGRLRVTLMWLLLLASTVKGGCGEPAPEAPAPDAGAAGDTGADSAVDAIDAGADTATGPDSVAEDASGEADVIRTDPVIAEPDADAGDSEEDSGPPGSDLQILGVTPERGSVMGGTELLVVGLGFNAATDVYLGGALCEDIDFVDETKITCSTPPNPAGAYDVKVVDELASAVLAGAFTYVAPVVVESIEPDRGPTEGGMPAVVRGTGFTPTSQVSIAGRLALGVEMADAETLRLLTPPGSAGSAAVQVSNENGLSRLEDGFTYLAPLRLSRVLPGVGDPAGGETVLVEGSGFLDHAPLELRFGLVDAEIVEIVDDGQLRAVTPPGAAGSWVEVTVASAEGEFTLADAFYYGQLQGDLALATVFPPHGSSAGGTEVVLSGVGLSAVTEVRFGGAEASVLAVDGSGRYLIVTTPMGAPGSVDVSVESADDEAVLEGAFTYLEPVAIEAVSPDQGPTAGGTAVELTGEGFEEGLMVRVGVLYASEVEVVSPERVRLLTPPGVVGAADVMVATPAGATARLEGAFTYTSELVVHGLTPPRGSVAGGTWVVVRGAGFVDPIDVFFGDLAAPWVEVLDGATLSVYSPPHDEGYVEVSVSRSGAEPMVSPERFLYFDPLSNVGGNWGEPIDGAVNVSVISTGGAPLGDAFVMLGARDTPEFSGYTDPNGQVTLSGPGLEGPQVVTASRPGFSSSTVHAVDAENVTVILSCSQDGPCFGDTDCRDGLICDMGVCIDPMCSGEGQPPPPPPFGVITGQLRGIHKVDDPGPDERVMGGVFTTSSSPFQSSSVRPGNANVLEDDGPYTLRSRIGEVALVAICGLYNDETREFTGRYLGVQRGLFIVDAETYNVDIECNIELDQSLTIKAISPPFTPEGPDNFVHQAILDFGSEGYFGGFPEIQGTEEILTGTGFAPLEGPLAGLSYYVRGLALTGRSWPYSVTLKPGVRRLDENIVLPEFLPVPQLVTPAEGGLLVERYLEWELATDVEPDFVYVEIYDFMGITYWDVYLPGDHTRVNLPIWPDTAEVGLFPSGPLIVEFVAIDAERFDFNDYNLDDLTTSRRRAYSASSFTISNP